MQRPTPETPDEKCAESEGVNAETCRSRLEEELKVCSEVNSFEENVCISCRGIDVEIDFKTTDNIYVNDIGTVQLNYCFRITGQDDYQLCVKNVKTNQETSYKKIIGEGSLFLEFPGIRRNHTQNGCRDETTTPLSDQVNHQEEVASTSSSTQKLSEYSEGSTKGSCETIELVLNSENEEGLSGNIEIIHTLTKICSNCSRVVEDETIYHCLFGHDSCKKCKGKPCILCQTMMGESKTYCKNHHKGCPLLQPQEQLTKHEIDCEFNNFRCPFPRCVFLNTLTDLKTHFLNSHNKSLIQSNTILEVLNGRKDRKWYMYCFGSLFVCSYYYYVTHIEFILQYIGANDNAKSFRFEVEIKTMKEKKLSKKMMCAGWNDLSLCKGVCYNYEDLNCDNSRFQFTANLKIVNISNNGLYTSI